MPITIRAQDLFEKIKRKALRHRGICDLRHYQREHAFAEIHDQSSWCFLLSADAREPYFTAGTLTTIRSLQQTNPGIPIAVIYEQLHPDQHEKLDGCIPVQRSASAFSSGSRDDLGSSSFLRFFFTELPYSRIIYVDSDTVVTDSLADIFRSPMPLMACPSQRPLEGEYKSPSRFSEKFGITDRFPLFNAGLLALSAPFWQPQNLPAKARSIGLEMGWSEFLNADQGIWNIIAYQSGGYAPLPIEYNYRSFSHMLPNEGETVTSSTGHLTAKTRSGHARVLHWVGGLKPWLFDQRRVDSDTRKRLLESCYLQFCD